MATANVPRGPESVPRSVETAAWIRNRLESLRKGTNFSVRGLLKWTAIIAVIMGIEEYVRKSHIAPIVESRQSESDALLKQAVDPHGFDGNLKLTQTPVSAYRDGHGLIPGNSFENSNPPPEVLQHQMFVLLERMTKYNKEYTAVSGENSFAHAIRRLKGELGNMQISDEDLFRGAVRGLKELKQRHTEDSDFGERIDFVIKEIEEPEDRLRNFIAEAHKWYELSKENVKDDSACMGFLLKMFYDLQCIQNIDPDATFESIGISLNNVEAMVDNLITNYENNIMNGQASFGERGFLAMIKKELERQKGQSPQGQQMAGSE